MQGYCCSSPGTAAKLSFSLRLEPFLLWARSFPYLQIERMHPGTSPSVPLMGFFFFIKTPQLPVVIPWTTQVGARQISLPKPAFQITDSNKKAFTISIFTSDMSDYCSISGRVEQTPSNNLTNSRHNAAGSKGGWDKILIKSVSSRLQKTCV